MREAERGDFFSNLFPPQAKGGGYSGGQTGSRYGVFDYVPSGSFEVDPEGTKPSKVGLHCKPTFDGKINLIN